MKSQISYNNFDENKQNDLIISENICYGFVFPIENSQCKVSSILEASTNKNMRTKEFGGSFYKIFGITFSNIPDNNYNKVLLSKNYKLAKLKIIIKESGDKIIDILDICSK